MGYARFRRDKDERNGASSVVLHKSTASGRSGDCDRSSVRVFEAQLASQPHGDWLSGTRNAQKAVSDFLIRVARDNGLYISEDQVSSLGERKQLPSGESIIFENASQGIVYKVRDPFAKLHLKNGRAIDVLYDHIVHNVLFPEASYTFIGVSSIFDEVRFILAQPFFFSRNTPTQKQIDDALATKGLLKENSYYYGNEYLSVTDVSASSDNVILSDDGRMVFIDPIIKLKKPIDEVIAYYSSYEPQSDASPKAISLWERIRSLLSV